MITERKKETIQLGGGEVVVTELTLRKLRLLTAMISVVAAKHQGLMNRLTSTLTGDGIPQDTGDTLAAVADAVQVMPGTVAAFIELATNEPAVPRWQFWRRSRVRDLVEDSTPGEVIKAFTAILRINNLSGLFGKKAPGNGEINPEKLKGRLTVPSPASPSKQAGPSTRSGTGSPPAS